MALTSSKVAAGQTILADHLNKLRDDMLSNHDHDGTYGAQVDHGDLLETSNIGSMGHRHEDIKYHMQGGGPGANNIDNPGGEQGVHGLAASAYVVGSLNSSNGLVIQAGYEAVSATSGSVSFDTTFTSIICVVLTPHGTISANDTDVFVTSFTTSGFAWNCAYQPTGFGWIAVGTKT